MTTISWAHPIIYWNNKKQQQKQNIGRKKGWRIAIEKYKRNNNDLNVNDNNWNVTTRNSNKRYRGKHINKSNKKKENRNINKKD